jgi:DNA-binding NarL/FixJ family response regulator
MLEINLAQPLVVIGAIVGLLSMALASIAWWMRRSLVRANSDIIQLRQVVKDLISIQEYRLAKLKAEIGTPQTTPQTAAQAGAQASAQTAAAHKPTPSKPPNSEIAERKRHIWSLAEKGLSAEEIARRIGLPYGQVEVLLNMRSYSESIHA